MDNQANSEAPEDVPPGAEALGGTSRTEPTRLTAVVSGLLDDVQNRPDGTSEKRVITDWLTRSLMVGNYSPETAFSRYSYELWRVRAEALRHLVVTFIPKDLQWMFLGSLKSGLEQAKDRRLSPVELVQNALFSKNGFVGENILRFMASRDLALGFYFLWLVTEAEYQGKMERERWDQTKKTMNDRQRFEEWLQGKGIITGPATKYAVHTAHEQEKPFRCIGIVLGKDREVFVTPPWGISTDRRLPDHYAVRLATPGGEIPALFTVRRKGVIQTIAKMTLLGITNPRYVPDRRGIRFSFRNLEELRAGSEFIFGKIGLALSRKEIAAMTGEGINPHASPTLTMMKDSAIYLDRDIEIQCMLARQHVDLMRSHGDENSILYHRRQYTDPKGILPQVFPQHIYLVDWQSEEIHARMDAHIIASIPK